MDRKIFWNLRRCNLSVLFHRRTDASHSLNKISSEELVWKICPELANCLINIQRTALTKPRAIKVYQTLIIFGKKPRKYLWNLKRCNQQLISPFLYRTDAQGNEHLLGQAMFGDWGWGVVVTKLLLYCLVNRVTGWHKDTERGSSRGLREIKGEEKE